MNLINLIKSTVSGLRRSARITLFNLVGLSISFAVFNLLAIYLYNEYTYNRSNTKSEQLYLLESNEINRNYKHPFLPNPLGELLENNFSEIEQHCTIKSWSGIYSKKNDRKQMYNLNLYTVDSTFTDMFTLNIIEGNQLPFTQKKSIILSETASKKLFGKADPIGRVLMRNFKEPATVVAVYEDLPANNSFHKMDGFCSFITHKWIYGWSEWSYFTYFFVPDNVNVAELENKINQIEKIKEISFDDNGNRIRSLHLTPLPDMHFESVIGDGNKKLVTTLFVVALLLIVMAFINYLNFSFAGLPKKAKVVSLRKISGAGNFQIFLQSFIDAAVLISVSYFLGMLIASSILKIYPDVYGYRLNLNDNLSLLVLTYFLLLCIGTFLTIFPGRLLLTIEPAQALKGILPFSVKTGKTKYVLPVLQYVVAIMLIAGVVLINKQIAFVKDFDLGFDKENVLVIESTSGIKKQEQAFVDELLKCPEIKDYAFSQFVPGGVGMGWGREMDGQDVNYKAWPIDERYMNFMGFEVLKGRGFSSNIKLDENKFIFNQAALKAFGWQDDIIGKTIHGMDFEGEIIGVVKDMKYASLYNRVEPMCFWLTTQRHDKLSIRIAGNNVSQTIAYIKQVYGDFEKQYPMEFSFLDKTLDRQYRQTEKQAELITFACIIALIIAVIGTLGMVIFTCEYRIKEIGIRKTNGASVIEILNLLNKTFFWQVAIAFIIACPIAWYVMDRWLEQFAYKTSLSWWIFALAGILTLAITLLTVTRRSYTASNRNPVKSLRYE